MWLFVRAFGGRMQKYVRSVGQALPSRPQIAQGVAHVAPFSQQPATSTHPANPSSEQRQARGMRLSSPSKASPRTANSRFRAGSVQPEANLNEVSQLLQGIRRAAGLSPVELASQTNTKPAVIVALEQGNLGAIPPWPESRRIVDQWVAMAGLDPRPALETLALVQISQPQGAAPAGASAAAARAKGHQMRGAAVGFLKRLWRRPSIRWQGMAAGLGLPPSRIARWAALVLILASVVTAASQNQVVAGALFNLPAPAERAVRTLSDFFAVRFAPHQEGHRWISVEDPRSRRGDKLRIKRHSD